MCYPSYLRYCVIETDLLDNQDVGFEPVQVVGSSEDEPCQE